MAKRGKGERVPLIDALAQLAKRKPRLLKVWAQALDLLAARPGATTVLVNPEGIPPGLPMAEILKRANAAKRGKPIRWTVDYRDGTPPVIVDMPLTDDGPEATEKKTGGRPRKLTLEEYRDHLRRHPGDLSDGVRARMLGVKRTTVWRIRHQLERRRKNPGAK
jgi:hypothetical protein